MSAKASDFLPLIDQREPIHLEAKKGFYRTIKIKGNRNNQLLPIFSDNILWDI